MKRTRSRGDSREQIAHEFQALQREMAAVFDKAATGQITQKTAKKRLAGITAKTKDLSARRAAFREEWMAKHFGIQKSVSPREPP